MGVRQRSQQHSVGHAENGCAGTASQSYGQRRRQGEDRALAQYTSCNCQIAKIHHPPPESFEANRKCNVSARRRSRAIPAESRLPWDAGASRHSGPNGSTWRRACHSSPELPATRKLGLGTNFQRREPKVGLEEIAIDLLEARYWTTSARYWCYIQR